MLCVVLARLTLDEALGVFQVAIDALNGVVDTRLLRIVSNVGKMRNVGNLHCGSVHQGHEP